MTFLGLYQMMSSWPPLSNHIDQALSDVEFSEAARNLVPPLLLVLMEYLLYFQKYAGKISGSHYLSSGDLL